MKQIRYVLVNVRTGEIEASGSCDAQSFDMTCEADGQIKVIGPGSSATHYYTPMGLQEYTLAQRLAKATLKPHCTWDNRLMRWVDVRSFAELRAERWALIKAARTAEIDAPIDTPFGRFDADAPAREAVATAAALGESVVWTTANNLPVQLASEQLVMLLRLIGQRAQVAHARARALRGRIEAAQSMEELESVIWATGTPESGNVAA